MKLKVVRIFVNNEPDKFGVWPDDGRPSFGRKPIQIFDTEAEAVRIANDTPYGLTNYVQSQDGARRNRLARALRSGMVEMNGQSRGAGSPFGGIKASGRAREGGVWGIEEFLEAKAISGWDSAQDMAAE